MVHRSVTFSCFRRSAFLAAFASAVVAVSLLQVPVFASTAAKDALPVTQRGASDVPMWIFRSSGLWHDGVQLLSFFVKPIGSSIDALSIQSRIGIYVRYDCVRGYWRSRTYSRNLQYRFRGRYTLLFFVHRTYTTSWQHLF